MARKNVSAHTDEQFALFVNQIGTILDGEKEAQFESVVRRLVRVSAGEVEDGCDATDRDAVGDAPLSPEPSKRTGPATGGGATSTLPPRPDFEAIEKAAR